jgi:Spy/CpxP family protein refolding chaperone
VKKIIVAVTMVALLATAGLVMAQDWGKGSGMGMGFGPHSGGTRSEGTGLWGGLNLTAEQMQKMQALRENFFKEKIPLRNELALRRLEMRGLWMQTNPDEAKIMAKQKEMNALRAQLGEKLTKFRLEMRKILTPEQQAKLINLRGHLWHRYPRYGRGCGFGPGPGYGRGMGDDPRW